MEIKFSHFALFEQQGFEQPSPLLKTCFEHTYIHTYIEFHDKKWEIIRCCLNSFESFLFPSVILSVCYCYWYISLVEYTNLSRAITDGSPLWFSHYGSCIDFYFFRIKCSVASFHVKL